MRSIHVLSAPQTPRGIPALLGPEPRSLTCHGACPSTTRPRRWPGRSGPPRGRCMLHSGRRGFRRFQACTQQWEVLLPTQGLAHSLSNLPLPDHLVGTGKTQDRSVLLEAAPLGSLLGRFRVTPPTTFHPIIGGNLQLLLPAP